jgi:hypothetical protein
MRVTECTVVTAPTKSHLSRPNFTCCRVAYDAYSKKSFASIGNSGTPVNHLRTFILAVSPRILTFACVPLDPPSGPAQRRYADIQRLATEPKTETVSFIAIIEESRSMAISHVYSSEIWNPIILANKPDGFLDQIALSKEYLANAGEVARHQAANAASRLAAVLESCLTK